MMTRVLPNIWHISAGPSNRPYADVLLRYGVALLGPGDAGPWRPDRRDEDFEGPYVRRFAAELQVGDVLLLRSGPSTLCAVGLVAGEYQYLAQFDDVNGWDLQHARRVRWCKLPEPYDFGAPVFGGSPPRLARVNVPEIVDYARRFIASPPTHWQTALLPPLPVEEQEWLDVPPPLQELVAQVQDLYRLYEDPAGFGEPPSEHELVAHYIIPLLRALGWPVERIALEWHGVDVALFRRLPRNLENCHLIVEAKRIGVGVEGALAQAQGYLQRLGIHRDIVVTDGVRYRLYAADKDFAPVAYANLARLKCSALKLLEQIQKP